MKIKEILSEDRRAFVPAEAELTTDEEFQKRFKEYVAPVLKQHCSQTIKAYKITFPSIVYRGVKTGINEFISPIVPTKRIAFLHDEIRDLINQAMIKAGATANRGNSMFCSSTTWMARSWGTEYIIFPYDNFSVTWFVNLKQGYFLDDVTDLIHSVNYDALSKEKEKEILDKWIKDQTFEKMIQKAGISFANNEQGIIGALKSGSEEILISGSEYVALKSSLYKNTILRWLS